MPKSPFVVLLAGLMLCACAGESGSSDGGEDGGLDPECGAAELVLLGSLDGQSLDFRVPVGEFVQTIEPPVAIVYPAEGGRIRFEFPAVPMEGQSTPAMATLSLGGVGGPDVGNCRTEGHPSQLTVFVDRVEFVLIDLYASPFCGAASAPGEIRGCATFP